MFDAIFKLIDRIIVLLQAKQTDSRKLFEDHIQPTFLEMTAIHRDYRSGFQAIEEQLQFRPDSPELIQELVVKRKEELEYLRIKGARFWQGAL